MKKRSLALLMVCILALSMPANVFAADTSETVITALYKEPNIEVYVPTAGQMYLNPESLPLIVDGRVDSGQIINTPWSIENRSEVAIIVDASVHAEINENSNMTLYTRSALNSTSKLKRAFIYLDMRITDPDKDLLSLNWDETVYNSKKQILVSPADVVRNGIMTLAPAGEDGAAASGGVGAFRLCGNATAKPTEPWDPTVDNVSVHITFTFRPTVLAT